MASDFNVIIKSPAILEDVVNELDLSSTAGELKEKLQVASEENSQVVTVTATDTNPEQAVKIANSTVETFQEKIPTIMNVDNVSILAEAELAENPSQVSPNPYLNIAIAIVLGAMVGVGLAFSLEYLDNTITTEDDIEKKIGLPVLGVISHIIDKDVRGEHMDISAKQAKRGDYNNGTQKRSV